MKFLSNFFQKKSNNTNLNHFFTYKGHKFYSWESFDLMPEFREMFVRMQYHKMGLNIGEADMNAFCETLLNFNANDKRDDITYLVKFFMDHIKEYTNEKMLLELAGYVILIDNEDPMKIDTGLMELKRKLLDESQELRFFFVNTALRLLQNLAKELDISRVKGYLDTSTRREREKTFYRLISSSITTNLWKT